MTLEIDDYYTNLPDDVGTGTASWSLCWRRNSLSVALRKLMEAGVSHITWSIFLPV